jgi:hypothetical protein
MKIERTMIVKLRGIPSPKMAVIHTTEMQIPSGVLDHAYVCWFDAQMEYRTTTLACDLLQVIDPMTDGLGEAERVYREIKDP